MKVSLNHLIFFVLVVYLKLECHKNDLLLFSQIGKPCNLKSRSKIITYNLTHKIHILKHELHELKIQVKICEYKKGKF